MGGGFPGGGRGGGGGMLGGGMGFAPCQLTTYPANRHPILPTDTLSCQPTPYPAN